MKLKTKLVVTVFNSVLKQELHYLFFVRNTKEIIQGFFHDLVVWRLGRS